MLKVRDDGKIDVTLRPPGAKVLLIVSTCYLTHTDARACPHAHSPTPTRMNTHYHLLPPPTDSTPIFPCVPHPKTCEHMCTRVVLSRQDGSSTLQGDAEVLETIVGPAATKAQWLVHGETASALLDREAATKHAGVISRLAAVQDSLSFRKRW